MSKVNNYLILITIWLVIACSQDREPIAQQLIEEHIQRRLAEHRASEKVKCKNTILEEAIATVDSILRANPIDIKIDSMTRPPVPPKPSHPEFTRRKDSIVIAPILPSDSISVDTVNEDTIKNF